MTAWREEVIVLGAKILSVWDRDILSCVPHCRPVQVFEIRDIALGRSSLQCSVM